jgi:hypothetical protein
MMNLGCAPPPPRLRLTPRVARARGRSVVSIAARQCTFAMLRNLCSTISRLSLWRAAGAVCNDFANNQRRTAAFLDSNRTVSLLITRASATNFANSPEQAWRGEKPGPKLDRILSAAARKSYDDLKKAHVADHRKLYSRVSIDLGPSQHAQPTDQRITTLRTTNIQPRQNHTRAHCDTTNTIHIQSTIRTTSSKTTNITNLRGHNNMDSERLRSA